MWRGEPMVEATTVKARVRGRRIVEGRSTRSGTIPPPQYRTARRGKGWTHSLIAAMKNNAVVIVEETGIPVSYDRDPRHGRPGFYRPWVDEDGQRYDSRDCVPDW